MHALRQICNPDDPYDRTEHMHQCFACSITWKHSNALETEMLLKGILGDPDEAQRLWKKAHSCPECGEKIYLKFPQERERVIRL